MRIFLAIIAVFLSSCAAQVKSDVLVFHSSPDFYEKTFSIKSTAKQLDSLEYVEYANLISDELEQRGLKFVTNASKANYLVSFKYSVDSGKTEIRSDPVRIGVGGHRDHFGGYYSVPFGYNEFSSRTTYTRLLEMDIYNKKSKKVFESRVTNAGSDRSFFGVSKCMIKAMFEGFPQTSGKAQRVVVPRESCPR